MERQQGRRIEEGEGYEVGIVNRAGEMRTLRLPGDPMDAPAELDMAGDEEESEWFVDPADNRRKTFPVFATTYLRQPNPANDGPLWLYYPEEIQRPGTMQ